jgi:hypothetical protein
VKFPGSRRGAEGEVLAARQRADRAHRLSTATPGDGHRDASFARASPVSAAYTLRSIAIAPCSRA